MINYISKYSDSELLELIKADKKSFDLAFLEIYNRTNSHVYFYCLKIMGDEDLAKDTFQEVYIKFSEVVKRTDEISSFKHYLIKIARNVCLDAKNQSKETSNMNLELINTDSFGYNLNLAEEDERIQLINFIESCVNLLEEDEREILIFRQYQGMGYPEIEEITGIPQNYARTKFYRAKEKLKNMLLPYFSKQKENNKIKI